MYLGSDGLRSGIRFSIIIEQMKNKNCVLLGEPLQSKADGQEWSDMMGKKRKKKLMTSCTRHNSPNFNFVFV